MKTFTSFERNLRKYFRPACLLAACLIVMGTSQSSDASLVRVNGDDNNTAPTESEEATTYVFTDSRTGDLSVPSNSSFDLAQGITPVIITGMIHGASASIAVLTDGSGGGDGGVGGKFFFDNNASSLRLRTSLAQISTVGQINTYSWQKGGTTDADNRAHQRYNVWASDGTAGGFLINDETSPGWTLLANATQTNTRAILGNTDGQVGVSINPDSGVLLGNYQHFIFEFFPTNPADSLHHTFLSEIDILAPVPEPSTIALASIGSVGLVAVRRRRHR